MKKFCREIGEIGFKKNCSKKRFLIFKEKLCKMSSKISSLRFCIVR